jgi:type I restriction enzyme S subunit
MNKVNVPQLRFKGFDKEWNIKKIGNIAELTSSKRVYLTDYVESGIPFYRGKEITELKSGRIPNDILYITESSYEGFKEKFGVPQKDDLLITAVGTLGNVLRIKDETKFYFKDGNLIWFRKITEFSSFLEIALDVYKSEIEKTSIGSTQRALTMAELRKLNFPFPSLEEQQKIASFLSAVDEKIQQLSRKKELLEQYKKGVMQQLFSGKLRFKDENGNDYADWEEKKLGEIGSVISGLTYSPDDINEDGVLVLRSSNVQSRKLSFHDNVYVKTPAYNPVELNDILICVRNGSKHLIGKNTIINKETVGVAFGAFMSVYRSKYNLFLFHYFDTDEYKNEVHKNLGATINSINGSDLKKFKIPFPSIEEQQKIANFLSNIDAKIESTNQQITQTQSFKKGLLQQMFV